MRRIPALRSLLTEPGPDLLGIFRKEDDENAHSDVLRWLLDPAQAPNVAPVALRALFGRLRDPVLLTAALNEALDLGCVCVRREVVLGRDVQNDDSLDRTDLVVSGPRFVVGIENKVWSTEHGEQTRAYARSMESFGRTTLTGGIFLSPTGMPPS